MDKSAHGLAQEVLRGASFSDWLLLYSLGKNMERSVFTEFILFLHHELTTLPTVQRHPEKELKKQLFREDFIDQDMPKERDMMMMRVREY